MSDEIKIESVPSLSVLETLNKSEIDMQISTAKAFPRDIVAAKAEMLQLATQNVDTAELCVYALTRKQRNKDNNQMETVVIQGPSVRLAEIVVYSYGNIRAGARTIGNDGTKVKAQGFCHDLQRNVFSAFEVERSIRTKAGFTYSPEMQVTTANAAGKIAYRNAVFATIPGAFWQDIYQACLNMVKGKPEDLPKRVDVALKWFASKGVLDVQVFESIDVKNRDQIDQEKLQILSGMKSSIVNGEFTVEDLFPKPEPDKKEAGKKAEENAINMMAGKKK